VEKNSGGTQTAAWSYAYDLAGNRTGATIGTTANTFGYNAANQLTSRNGNATGWSHDANGNQTAAVGALTRTAAVNIKDQYTSFTIGGVPTAAGYLGAGQDERSSTSSLTASTIPVQSLVRARRPTTASTSGVPHRPDEPVPHRPPGGSFAIKDGQWSWSARSREDRRAVHLGVGCLGRNVERRDGG
jgi:hypothetical protein